MLSLLPYFLFDKLLRTNLLKFNDVLIGLQSQQAVSLLASVETIKPPRRTFDQTQVHQKYDPENELILFNIPGFFHITNQTNDFTQCQCYYPQIHLEN